MLDPRLVRENIERVGDRLHDRGAAYDLSGFAEADATRRRLLTEVEQLKHRRNTLSEEVGRRKRKGQKADELIAETRALGERIKQLDEEVHRAEEQIDALLLPPPTCPTNRSRSGGTAGTMWRFGAGGRRPASISHPAPTGRRARRWAS